MAQNPSTDVQSDDSGSPLTYETIYVGNFRFENVDPKAKFSRQAVLFLSTKNDSLAIPTTIGKVTYTLKTNRRKRKHIEVTNPPFFHSINIYGSFAVQIKVEFKDNTEISPNYNQSKHIYQTKKSLFKPKREDIGGEFDPHSVHTISMDHSISISGIDPILRTSGIGNVNENDHFANMNHGNNNNNNNSHFNNNDDFSTIIPRKYYNAERINILKFSNNNRQLTELMKMQKLKDSNEMSKEETIHNHVVKTKANLKGFLKGRQATIVEFRGFKGDVDDFVKRFWIDTNENDNDDEDNDKDNDKDKDKQDGKDKNVTNINIKNTKDISKLDKNSDLKVFLGSIPKDVLSLIGKYYTFDRNGFVRTKEIKSEWSRASMRYAIEIVDCSDCLINLTALSYFKQLDILNCKNLYVMYNDTATAQSEIFHSSNVIVERCEDLEQPSGFRFDTCDNCECIFIDTGERVTITTFGCTNCKATVVDVCEQDIPDQKDSKSGYITTWRGDNRQKEAKFTGKPWTRQDALARR